MASGGGPMTPDKYIRNADGSVTLVSGDTGQPHTYDPDDLGESL